MEIFRHHFHSPVGWEEISGTENFICAVLFHDEEPSEILKSEIPLLKKCEEQLQAYFSGTRKHFDLPVQQTGSDFQQRVWNELQKIPFGTTISYLELSKRLGDVKAIRAAASANGKNKMNIIIPCHRVIGSDGSLTGYGGKLWRKEWLLKHEGSWPVQPELFERGNVRRV